MATTYFVPFTDLGVILGSANWTPWLAASVEEATTPGHPQGQPVFAARELAEAWVEWTLTDERYSQMGKFEIREVSGRARLNPAHNITQVFGLNG